jgi:penicillin-binding protein 1A
VREDAPIDRQGLEAGELQPRIFRPVTLTQALAMSLNTVAVRLTWRSGRTERGATAHRLGIASKLERQCLDRARHLGSLVIELVGAYAPFANGGSRVAPHVVERVRTADGKVLYRAQPRSASAGHRAALRRDDEPMMQETLLSGTARKAELGRAGRPPARPAPARISATPGSSATPPTSSPASGSAMTTTRRPRRRPAAACRSRSGAAS